MSEHGAACAFGSALSLVLSPLLLSTAQNKREIVNVVYESRANPADHNKLHEASSASQFAQ